MGFTSPNRWSDLLFLLGFIALPLSLSVGELVTPASADFLDHCPKDCNCKWANGKREADCTRTGFTAVPTHLDAEIQILRMTHNYVRVLGREVFKAAGLLNLQRIFMNHCHVQEIHSTAFRDLRILVELDLSHNNLTHLEADTFSGNERLQTLTLSHNKLSAFSPYVFPVLKHLKSIDLSHNYIDEIHRHTFENLGNSVESLSLDNNRISSLREEIFLPLTNLKSLQLHSNPWNCDCHLKNFRDWVVFRGLYTYPTSCAEPERLADKLWQDVDPKDYACKPDIRVPQSVVFSQPGANVTLSCFIIGDPKPDAKWVLKGRIVNNNTIPSGGPVPAGQPPASSSSALTTVQPENDAVAIFTYSSSSSTTTQLSTSIWSSSAARAAADEETATINMAGPKQQPGPTQYLIHEEGGLERWFNLTITNVGLEAVADYTCVAVNAGGVMEEAITLTFEEPEPVGLPGGKKESQESHLAIIIGAAAGGILFSLVVLLVFCCCCCRKRGKMANSNVATNNSGASNSSSQGGATSLERNGSIIGFTDSNQKLLMSPQQSYGKSFPPTTAEGALSKSCRIYGGDTTVDYQGLPQAQSDMEILSSSSGGTSSNHMQYELQPVMRSPILQARLQPQQPKTLMVTSSGETFRSFTDPDQFPPDLLNIVVKKQPSLPSPALKPMKAGQPLNPAALVIPPAAPAQFPHQFQHLIHNKGHQGVQRAHSPVGSPNVVVSPLLSPPAQFSSDSGPVSPKREKGYVTLPRKLQSTSRGLIDWTSMTERPPIYDGVGPRTSAAGSSAALKMAQNKDHCHCSPPAIPELDEHLISSSSVQKRSSSLKRFPESKRDSSSGSEVTLGDTESLTAYVEPFGKATSNHKNTCSNRPDSIASAVDSELDAILSTEPNFTFGGSKVRRKSCPVHNKANKMTSGQNGPKIISIPADLSTPVVQVASGKGQPVKQLKGILKASKSNTIITSNPMVNDGRSSPPPTSLTSETSVHISKAGVLVPKPPVRTSSNANSIKSSSSMSEALHV